MASTSRIASAARLAGLVGVGLFALGPLAIQLGLASPFLGFRIFGLGLLAGLAALLLGLVGVATTRASSGRAGRAHALTGLLLGVVVVACVAFAARPGIGVPAINDITTDPSDPPLFSDPGKSYPGAEFADAQRAAYPDLAPIPFEGPPAAAYAASLAAAQGLGWEIARQDAQSGSFEATDTTLVFRFVDDISVRVRPDAAGARVDLRSKSRDGKGDLGANAARIRAFRDALAKSGS
jgi:uncharacterized protein (DUF1499 family)